MARKALPLFNTKFCRSAVRQFLTSHFFPEDREVTIAYLDTHDILEMATTNIFYRIPSQHGTRIASITGPGCTLQQFTGYLEDVEGLEANKFSLACNTRIYRPGFCGSHLVNLENNSQIDILIPLLGGKGGFGSLLRAIGAQIEKTTNRDACRDLSGRRLRDIKREEELKKLIALQERLIEERKRRRLEKLEKLKKKNDTSSTSASIQELVAMFDDHEYNKRRLELGDIIEAAVDKGIINFKKRQQSETEISTNERNKKSRLETVDEGSKPGELSSQGQPSGDSTNIEKTLDVPQSETFERPPRLGKIKKKDLWLGLEGDSGDENI